jgi:hypothetical protein
MAIKAGEVAWYVTGRFYAIGDSVLDCGFFLHLQDALIDPKHLTFAAQPFKSRKFSNGDLKISMVPVGEFSIYYSPEPVADYDDPLSFSRGLCVATFRRVSIVTGVDVAGLASTNVFSSRLIASTPFEHDGRRIDFAELVPFGVTQWGTASDTAIVPPPQGYASAFPFVGSAIAVGAV